MAPIILTGLAAVSSGGSQNYEGQLVQSSHWGSYVEEGESSVRIAISYLEEYISPPRLTVTELAATEVSITSVRVISARTDGFVIEVLLREPAGHPKSHVRGAWLAIGEPKPEPNQ